MKKRILSVLLCLCMVCTLLPTMAMAASTNISNFAELQTAFSDGGDYTLAANITVTEQLTLNSGKTLTIHGNGRTIQPEVTGLSEQGNVNANASAIDNIIQNSGTLTLENLTIYGGKGRCIYNSGTLTMTGVSLERAHLASNLASNDKYGAGLYNAAGATAILTNCNICDNINGGDKSGSGNGGGFYNAGTLVMENCAIVGNETPGTNGYGGGGGGYNCGTLYMNNCTVANNQSTNMGGGIYQNGDGTTKTYLMNSTVTGNMSNSYGGGINIYGGSLYAVNSVFAFNYKSGTINDIYGSASLYSCVYGSGSTDNSENGATVLTIENTQESVTALFNAADSVTVNYNTCCRPAVTEFTKAGFTSYGVYLKAGSDLTSGGTKTYYERTGSTVKMSYGDANTALGTLGAASNEVTTYQDGTTRAAGVIGALSSTPPHTHALCQTAGCMQDHNDDGNSSNDHDPVEFTAWDTTNSLPTTAGNYYLTTDVTLTSTWKPVDGTVLCLNGKKIIANGDFDCIQVTSSIRTLTLCDCKPNGIEGCITHSSIGKTGHGVNTTGTFNMYGGTISGNNAGASASGGGVYVDGKFNMYGGTISGNKTEGSSTGGGVFVVSGGTFTMSGTASITGNTANSHGGGVYVVGGGRFTMTGGSITGNTTASNSGGGVFSLGTFTMTGGTIGGADNAANKAAYGGGVYVSGSNSKFTMSGDASITGNSATGTGGSAGGGVYVNNGGEFTMSGGSITGNTANYNGGGVYMNTNGTFNMSGGTIGGTATGAANTAPNGGGVYVNGGNFEMSGGTICNNTATSNSYGGGGVYVAGTFKMSENASITGNTAKANGGGVFVYGGNFEMSGTASITGNTTTDHTGGGVYVCNYGTFTMSENASITGNTAATYGGGVCMASGTFTMSGGTICNNTATSTSNGGGGVYVGNSSTMNVSGGVKITGNKKGDYDNNVYLPSDKKITITGAMGTEARIDVTTATAPTAGSPVPIAQGETGSSGYTIESGNKNYFFPDAGSDYSVVYNSQNHSLDLTVHQHNWEYNSTNDTITANCAGCSTSETLTISASNATYDGSAKAATLSSRSGFTSALASVAVNYQKKTGDSTYDTATTTAPTNAGTYKASITVGGETASVEYTITPITLTDVAINAIANQTYTGSAIEPEVTVTSSETVGSYSLAKDTDYTVEYANNTAVGTATVTVTAMDGSNYTFSSPVPTTFNITSAAIPDAVTNAITGYTGTYDGNAHNAVVIGNAANGYTVQYSDAENGTYSADMPQITNVSDSKTVWVEISRDNYTTVKKPVDATVSKATQTITVPNDKTIFKNGVAVDISNWASVAGAAGGSDPGTLTYALDSTYDGVTLVGNKLTVPSSFTGNTVTIKVTAEETSNYNSAEETFAVTVNAKSQETLAVTQDGWTYGETTVAPVYNPVVGATTTITYAVKDSGDFSETVPTNAGDYTVKVVLETATTVYTGTANFTISKAAGSLTAPTAKTGLVYNGNAQQLINAGSSSTGTIQYKLGSNGTYSTSIPTATNAGTYTVYYKLVGDANHNDVAEASITVTIGAKQLTLDSATATGREYAAGNNNVVISTVTFNEEAPVPTLGSGFTASGVMDTDAAGTGKSVTVTVTLTDTNYSLANNTINTTVDISKAAPSVTAPTAKTLTYNGSALELVNAGYATGGTMKYKVDSGDWTDSIPTGTNAGTYNVYYKVVGDDNHNDTAESGPVTVTISQAALGGNDASKNIRFNDIEEKTITADDFGLSQAGTFTQNGDLTDSSSVLASAPTYGSDIKVQLKGELALGTPAQTVTIPVTFTPSNANYAAKNYTLTITLINKTDVSGNITFNNGELTYTGTGLNYETATITDVSGGTWTYTYAAGSSPASLDSSVKPLTVGTYTVTATYEDSAHIGTKNATLTVTPKTVTAPAADSTVFTYTGAAQSYGISTTGDYTVSGNVQTDANESGHTVTVTLTDKVNTVWADTQNATDKEYSFVIRKATPTGTPTYTAITTGGKTLGDAPLAIGSITPGGGTITWDLGNAQTVAANTAYSWTYTPSDTDNYNNLTGSITPYVVSYSGGSSTPTYKVESEVTEDTDGSVSVSKSNAKKGDTVTITVTPDRHYKVEGVTVKDKNGNEIAVTDNGDGTFTFKMPDSKVAVEPVFSWDNPFTDMAEDTYYAPAVEWALKNDVTNGTGDGTTFSPNTGCTRAQIVTFLWRAAGCPEPAGANGFTDVSADAYYAKAVAWAAEQGITSGTGNGKFSPDAACTRSQSMTFLYHAAGSPEIADGITFSDVADGSYYADAVAWAARNGVTSGTSATTFSPNAACTRAQIMTFLYRWMVK